MYRNFLILALSLLSTLPLGAMTPAEKSIEAAINAAGGQKAFEALGVIKMEISESETLANGKKSGNTVTAYVETTLENSRLELPNGVVIVRNGNTGWATFGGKLDDRKQTPRMAPGSCRQKLMPFLMPFSLKIDGPSFSKPAKTTFQGQKMTRIDMTVKDLFFQSPLISRNWEIFLPENSAQAPITRYLPIQQFIKAHPEGMQIEITKRINVGGIQLPSKLMVHGVDASGKKTSHHQEVNISYEVVNDPSRALFLSPETLAKIDEGSPIQ